MGQISQTEFKHFSDKTYVIYRKTCIKIKKMAILPCIIPLKTTKKKYQ